MINSFSRRRATILYSPIHSRSSLDHSCVGRNLTVSCATIRAAFGGFYAALPHMVVRFLPTQEWSTGGRGLSTDWVLLLATICRGGDNAIMRRAIMPYSPIHSRSPRRPFLRRQESHSVVCHNWHAAFGGFYAALPHMVVRFLPSQEWSVGRMGNCWRILVLWLPLLRQRDSCFRRNGLVGDGSVCGILALLVAAADIRRAATIRRIFW